MVLREGFGKDSLTTNSGNATHAAQVHRTSVVANAFLAVKRRRLEIQTEIYRSTEIAVRIKIEE